MVLLVRYKTSLMKYTSPLTNYMFISRNTSRMASNYFVNWIKVVKSWNFLDTIYLSLLRFNFHTFCYFSSGLGNNLEHDLLVFSEIRTNFITSPQSELNFWRHLFEDFGMTICSLPVKRWIRSYWLTLKSLSGAHFSANW